VGIPKVHKAFIDRTKPFWFRLINRRAEVLPLNDPRRLALFGRRGGSGIEFYGVGLNNLLCKLMFSYFMQTYVGADERTQRRSNGIIDDALVNLLTWQPRPLVARMQP
jgi:hypothetical protein